jgi:hypothetical protein
MPGLHVRVETVQDVNLTLEEHDRVEVLEDIGGDDNWLARVSFTKNLLELPFEVVGIGCKAAVEEALTFEGLFLSDSLLFFVLHCLQLCGMVVGALPKEVNLLIGKCFHPIFQVVGDFIACHPVLQVFLAIVVTHHLVELLQLKPPASKNALHGFID